MSMSAKQHFMEHYYNDGSENFEATLDAKIEAFTNEFNFRVDSTRQCHSIQSEFHPSRELVTSGIVDMRNWKLDIPLSCYILSDMFESNDFDIHNCSWRVSPNEHEYGAWHFSAKKNKPTPFKLVKNFKDASSVSSTYKDDIDSIITLAQQARNKFCAGSVLAQILYHAYSAGADINENMDVRFNEVLSRKM